MVIKVRNQKLANWLEFAIWTEAEFIQLCAGHDPHGGNDEVAERRFDDAIVKGIDQKVIRAVEAGLLPVVSGDIGPTSKALSCRFRAVDAIKWAAPVFPDFPFELASNSSDNDEGESLRTPNWSKWRLMPAVKIWEAVALSLDIEPEKVKHNPYGWMAETHLFDESQEFKDRLEVAKARRTEINSIPRAINMSDSSSNFVGLWDFGQFALQIGWCLPTAFSDVPQEKGKVVSVIEQPKSEPTMQEHFTHDLQLLIQASNYFWKNADRTDKESMAKKSNSEVANWLVKQGFSSLSLALKGASIIRPKWAGVGRPSEG